MCTTHLEADELYYSNDPRNVLRFYETFDSAEELINWMRARPKANVSIHEVEGDTDIVIVIPTANVSSDYVKIDLDVYKGFHVIFCESSGRYFNYAHSVNICVKEAMKYNPEWVIFSNDDIYKIDEPYILRNQLKKLDYNDVSAILPSDRNYQFHYSELRILKPTFIKGYRSFLLGSLSLIYDEILRKSVKGNNMSLILLLARAQIYYTKLLRRFNLPYVDLRVVDKTLTYKIRDIIEKLLNEYINSFTIKKFGDFGGFSRAFLNRNNGVNFDETFINGVENYDLSFKLMIEKVPVKIIRYRKGSYKGRSLGVGINNRGISRNFRNFANYMYFAYKHYNRLLYNNDTKST
ncbi:hypothetical protein J5U23_01512 [Saccharolobus shibatae B12]|uniref:Uncharacterized protein n=1 Tax=Saccharolobus shibatae (strain ATCC 51178 / DSM 5389 / JCM 8931 / NBRC 15437 / B12) TaxID=523848 RepID=A0A8F5BP09_SACSH|nr:hypothetical protein [Saccharolobus shibatae]QXJ28643.1 hypothetical protein J5U23_01512 [Saccharolobus shibatae B12]